MKALTLLQPWATLVAIGAKKIETRSWSTKYRGPLAIHAGKSFPDAICLEEPIRSALVKSGYGFLSKLPLGAIVATCQLVDCCLITFETVPPGPEQHFGDYTPGRFAWLLEDVKMLPEPMPTKGRLGLWEWDGQSMTKEESENHG